MIPAKHKRGWRECRLGQSRFNRSNAEGRKEASKRSDSASRSSSFLRPTESFKSSGSRVWLWHSESYQPRAAVLSGSPAGGSTLVTVAPSCTKRAAATGPGVLILKLTALVPCSSDVRAEELIEPSFFL